MTGATMALAAVVVGAIGCAASSHSTETSATETASQPAGQRPVCIYPAPSAPHYIVFVLDRSGSMLEVFDTARQDIHNNLARLKPNQRFHVICFGGKSAEMEGRQLVPATHENLIRGAEFLSSLQPQGLSDPLPALERAFEVLDAARDHRPRPGLIICLVTDGDFPDGESVRQAIRKLNEKNEVAVHTVRVGNRSPEAERLLKAVAQENSGKYRLIPAGDDEKRSSSMPTAETATQSAETGPTTPEPLAAPASAARTRPARSSASQPAGPVHGDLKGTAAEFLAAALKDPDVGIMNPPADKDPHAGLDAKAWMERVSKAPAHLWLYPDGTPAEFNPQLRDRQRDARAGMDVYAVGYHRGWYPDGKVMFIEHFAENGLVWARYYDADGKSLSKIDDGSGLALLMQTKRRPGLVRGELRYTSGKPANADGTFDESKYAEAVQRELRPQGQTLAMPWPRALGLAAHAMQYAQSQPASAASQPTTGAAAVPPPAWGRDGIGTIWQDGELAYGLRVKDGVMFVTEDAGLTMRELRIDLGCQARGLNISADGSIYIWGLVATGSPGRGIPNRILFSRDRGKTWTKTTAPVDYMVGLEVQDEGVIRVEGRYLPADVLGAGGHWFLLQPWFVMTTRGQTWTKLPHPFCGPLRVVERVSLGGDGTIYVIQWPGFLDPGGYQVLFSKGLDHMPIMAGGGSEQPKVVLSDDKRTFQVLVNGKPVAVADIATGAVTHPRQ